MRKTKLPPHIVLEKVKEVLWYIPSGHPTTLGITSLTQKHYPDGYKGFVVTNPDKWRELNG